MTAAPTTNLTRDGMSRSEPWRPSRRHIAAVRCQVATASEADSAMPRTRTTAGPWTSRARLDRLRHRTVCSTMDRSGERVSFLA